MNNENYGAEQRPEHNQLESLLRRAEARPRPPPVSERRIRQAVENEWRQVTDQRRIRRLGYGFAIAASVILAVVVSGKTLQPPAPASSSPIAVVEKVTGGAHVFTDNKSRLLQSADLVRARQTLDTGTEGRIGLAWHGGASIRLDTQTRIRINSPFELELLKGQIYLDIDPQLPGELPIIVRTQQGEIRHLGTQFMARWDSSTLVISVREGAIEIANAEQGTKEAAASGEQLSLADGQPVERRSLSLHDDSWQWAETVAPGFALEGRTLSEFIDWVARQSGRTVRYVNDSVERSADRTILHGEIDLPPSRALAAVLQTTDLEANESGEDIIIGRRG